jgi:hypothetical protein
MVILDQIDDNNHGGYWLFHFSLLLEYGLWGQCLNQCLPCLIATKIAMLTSKVNNLGIKTC